MPYVIQGILYDNSTIGGAPDYNNGDVFVPLKGITEVLSGQTEALNGQFDFSDVLATVTFNGVVAGLESSQAEVQVTQGSTTTKITLSSATYGVGNSMFVPVAFFYKAYGLEVHSDDNTKTISVG